MISILIKLQQRPEGWAFNNKPHHHQKQNNLWEFTQVGPTLVNAEHQRRIKLYSYQWKDLQPELSCGIKACLFAFSRRICFILLNSHPWLQDAPATSENKLSRTWAKLTPFPPSLYLRMVMIYSTRMRELELSYRNACPSKADIPETARRAPQEMVFTHAGKNFISQAPIRAHQEAWWSQYSIPYTCRITNQFYNTVTMMRPKLQHLYSHISLTTSGSQTQTPVSPNCQP